MTPTSAVRSFAITLAIAITIVEPRVSAFTVHRTNSTSTTSSPVLSSGEVLHLQVKDDIRSLRDVTGKNEDSNKTIQSNETKINNEKLSITPEMKTGKTLNVTRTTVAVESTTENFRIPTISSDTVEVFDSVEDTKLYNKTEETTNNSIKPIKLEELKTTEKSVQNKEMDSKITSFSQTEPPIELLTIVDHIATESDKTGDYSTRKTVARSILDNEQTTEIYNVTELPIITETATAILTEKAVEETDVDKTEFPLITTDIPQTVSNVFATTINNISMSTEPANLTDSDVTQTTTENINTKITEPLLGKYPKYTAIIRKRTTSSEETTMTSKIEDNEMKETTNTQINFEKAFNVTPIPSLEKLRINLLSNINQPALSQSTEKVTREVESTAPYTVDSTEPKKFESVETKRGGYIDNSEKATTPITAAIGEEMKEKFTDTYGTVDDNTATESESPDYKKVSGSESQSQMAEDAIQEEFLKEEALNNHKENAIRYHDEPTGIEVVKLDNSGGLAGAVTEDSLSVQPIERTKTTLYTPSPNYKPMKKIDVQPARPFVRDPDDNSWRNESISSLGIVFKPKNSSKSFKEVLKNKTKTEFNSLIEWAKEDIPDLRLRLEKIAEVRKTKKKKMNKDGEIVYTDYEENSAETSSTPIPGQIASSNFQPDLANKIELEIKTPMTTTNNMEGTTEYTPKVLDIFGRLSLDALATQKPKKYFNIAEYYDTTDEYDADYVTMSKLDLKRFTLPPRTTHPVPVTRPVEPYIPDRKPTVQYFPPRESPVSVNNVDQDFERKINMFTFKDHPKIEPRPSFVTVPPLPIATARPQEAGPRRPPARPSLRPAARPAGFVYPPAELNKNYYLTNAPTTTDSEAFLIDSGRLDRGSYVIKHYKDFLNAADDDGRSADFLPYHTTEQPRETLATEADKQTFRSKDDEEDYDTRFRKELLTRFVDNFNQNSERFKVDFPILYNNSVVHRAGAGPPAASSTFLKRMYHEGAATRPSGLLKKACEPNCELTVELSPAYELHYYVPNQEERQEQEPRSSPAPYRYGL